LVEAGYRRIRRANVRTQLDRGQWAGTQRLIVTADFVGIGSETFDVTFGTVFEGPPLFTYGVELQEDEVLTEGDYPHCTAGVALWDTKEASTNSAGRLLYLGATVWFRSVTARSYRLRLRMSFEGIMFKNPQYF
jgi:hypothetical protein